MSDRFFVAQPIDGPIAQLADSEAHHLIHVMRAKVGQEVTLFDGTGREFRAQIEKLGRSDVGLSVLESVAVDRELPVKVTLGVALPKGDRQRWLVEKAVELGVASIVPLQTERGVAQPSSKAIERLRRTVVEACKQCGRNHLAQIEAAQDWPSFVETAAPDAARLIAHPGGTRDFFESLHPERAVIVVVGPEGGLTEAEVRAAAEHGWKLVDLGPRTLRVETAAVAILATIAAKSD